MPRGDKQYLDIPPGTPSRDCRGCDARIYFVKNANGKGVPVDPNADETCHYPTERTAGRGLNHFLNCPAANDFSKRGSQR